MASSAIELREGGVYRIYGPLSFEIVEGEVFFLGRILKRGERAFVPKDRTYAAKSIAPSRVRISGDGRVEEAEPVEEAIDDWRELCERLLSQRIESVLVIGGTDSCKSTFATFLANYAIDRELRVAVIDGDVGQIDVGIPGTISLALVDRHICSLRELEPYRCYFVGSKSPTGREHTVICALSSLLSSARDLRVDLVVVNTDGWILGYKARAYKLSIIKALRPSAVVVMEGRGEAAPVYRALERAGYRVFLAKTPIQEGKDRELRKERRELAFLDFIMSSKRKKVSLERTSLVDLPLFCGESLEREELERISKIVGRSVVHCEKLEDSIVAVVRGGAKLGEVEAAAAKEALGVRHIMLIPEGSLKGALVGLFSIDFECLGAGIIVSIDYRSRCVHLLTRPDLEEERVRFLEIGELRVLPDGQEASIGRLVYSY